MTVRVVLLLVLGSLGAQAIVWRSDVEEVETEAEGEMKQVGQLLYFAGIASAASNGSDPSYGDRGSYARVSTAREWIRKTVGR